MEINNGVYMVVMFLMSVIPLCYVFITDMPVVYTMEAILWFAIIMSVVIKYL